jgi:small basic protein (TIGR04137 family)
MHNRFRGWLGRRLAMHLKNAIRPATFPAHFRIFNPEQFMSQHRSLKGASTIAARRNVLKRFERVDLLKKRSQWKETSKVIGLPKTKPDL